MDVGEAVRVYLDPGFKSWGIGRVAAALATYAPAGVEIVPDPAAADLEIIHVIGRHDHNVIRAENARKAGRWYAIIQYVMGSCRNPNPADWFGLWAGAKVTWSYYKLPISDYYHAPLAADPASFHPQQADKKWLVGTNGNAWAAECIGEVQLAAYQLNGRAVHVGPNFNHSPIVDYCENIADDELRGVYNACQWWAALRRKDGFEMPAVEALLCGVRPILFDTPNYRQWFDGLAEFVPETVPGELAGRLKQLLRHGPKPVTDAEREETLSRFDWQKIIAGFWNRCLS